MYLKMKHISMLLLTVCLFTLASCGWHLQGLLNIPPQLNAVYVETVTPYSDLVKELKKVLEYSHINIVNDPSLARLTINIISETANATKTTVATSQQTRNYTVNYSVKFSIKDANGKIIAGPFTESSSQTVTAGPNEILDNSPKLQESEKTLRRNVINKMLFVLSARDTMTALKEAVHTTGKKHPSNQR